MFVDINVLQYHGPQAHDMLLIIIVDHDKIN